MAQSDISTGNGMLPHCVMTDNVLSKRARLLDSNAADAYLMGICAGTIAGISFLAEYVVTKKGSYGICTPDGVTHAQSVSVAVRYLNSHPERLHQQFSQLVLDAVRDAWPCKR
jgi:hypothetical protein